MNGFDRFKELQKKQKAYQLVLGIASWDSNTEAPKACFPYRSEMLSLISGEYYALSTSEEYQEIVNALHQDPEDLSEIQKKEIRKAKKDIDKILPIPREDYVEYSRLVNLSQREWEEAKAKDDYDHFKPYLEKIIGFRKKMAHQRDPDAHPYNVFLDDFEEGMDMEKYDGFFRIVKEEIAPFAKEVLAVKDEKPPEFMVATYPRDKQKQFVEYLMDVLAFDKNRGLLKESVHPFTWNTHSKDVRFTVRYLENYLFSSVFAAIHELGHALYEQQVDEMFDMTNLKSGASMGMHESQSRFYENVVGRSLPFWEAHLPKLKKLFPRQLKGVDAEEFFRAANRVDETFIRVEADELTYPLHILIRYEIERMIFEGQIDVDDLPAIWNKKMKQYLNLDVEKPSQGILQDVHWSTGMFGYFPTYALGSAYAAQIYYTIKEELDFERLVREDDIAEINRFLKEKVHCYGKSKTPEEILVALTGEPFNPQYYARYLKEKYRDIYLK